MKSKIIIHTSARYYWEDHHPSAKQRFLSQYWGVFDEDLEKFDGIDDGFHAAKMLFSLKTKWKSAWRSPGYALFVSRDGSVRLMADHIGATTNGALGHNIESIHICWDGGIEISNDWRFVSTDNRSDNIKGGLISGIHDAIMWANENQGFGTIKEIKGHRDLPDVQKDCPCFDAEKEYEWILI